MQSLVIYAKYKDRVSAFYRQALDLVAVEVAATHDYLSGPGIEVIVHAIPNEYAADIEITTPPQPREDQSFKPVFVVADLEQVRAAAHATGGFLKPLDAAWHMVGTIFLDGWDPEGNVVQFKQPSP